MCRIWAFQPYNPKSSFPGGTVVKNPHAGSRDAGVEGSIPGSGRSSGGGNGNSLQYSCLENPMDRASWWATVHWVAESDTTERLSVSWASRAYLFFSLYRAFLTTHFSPNNSFLFSMFSFVSITISFIRQEECRVVPVSLWTTCSISVCLVYNRCVI